MLSHKYKSICEESPIALTSCVYGVDYFNSQLHDEKIQLTFRQDGVHAAEVREVNSENGTKRENAFEKQAGKLFHSVSSASYFFTAKFA